MLRCLFLSFASSAISSISSESGSVETEVSVEVAMPSSATTEEVVTFGTDASSHIEQVGSGLVGSLVELIGSNGLVGTVTRYSKTRDRYIVTMVSFRLPTVSVDRSDFRLATLRRGALVVIEGVPSTYDGLVQLGEPTGTFVNSESALLLYIISPFMAAVALERDRDVTIRRHFNLDNLRIIGYIEPSPTLTRSVRLDVTSLQKKQDLTYFQDAPLDVAIGQVVWFDYRSKRCDVIIRSLPETPFLSRYFQAKDLPELPWRLDNIEVSDLIYV